MKESVKQWIAALRSGEYKQGTGALRVEDHYCCLGVACDLYNNEVDGRWVNNGTSYWNFEVNGELMVAELPPTVAEWLGIRLPDGGWRVSDDSYDSLAEMNDHGLSFNDIADVLENPPDNLFVENE